ncbi:MAG: hypothetical protein ACK2T0_11060 [Anaerolineales bacterium]|jgi:hypothetical protein
MNYTMLLQDAPPDTSGYMIAGYVIFVVVMAIYLISLIARKRNLEQDLSTLRTIEAESKAKVAAPARAKRSSRKAGPPKTASKRPSTARKRPARKGR